MLYYFRFKLFYFFIFNHSTGQMILVSLLFVKCSVFQFIKRFERMNLLSVNSIKIITHKIINVILKAKIIVFFLLLEDIFFGKTVCSKNIL